MVVALALGPEGAAAADMVKCEGGGALGWVGEEVVDWIGKCVWYGESCEDCCEDDCGPSGLGKSFRRYSYFLGSTILGLGLGISAKQLHTSSSKIFNLRSNYRLVGQILCLCSTIYFLMVKIMCRWVIKRRVSMSQGFRPGTVTSTIQCTPVPVQKAMCMNPTCYRNGLDFLERGVPQPCQDETDTQRFAAV